jgi:activator of 2-hydroxyglutaryl-CoA dehydratase
LKKLHEKTKRIHIEIRVAITGSGAPKVSPIIGIEALPEIDALAASMEILDSDIEHIIEIGAESQKYLSFFNDAETGNKLMEDVIPGNKCAGGTGSF